MLGGLLITVLPLSLGFGVGVGFVVSFLSSGFLVESSCVLLLLSLLLLSSGIVVPGLVPLPWSVVEEEPSILGASGAFIVGFPPPPGFVGAGGVAGSDP